MESYCQSIVSQWETVYYNALCLSGSITKTVKRGFEKWFTLQDYEQRLQVNESVLMEAEVYADGEEIEYGTGIC